MKKVPELLIGGLIGALIGWCLGYTRPDIAANRDARKYLTTLEADDSTAAIFAVQAIPVVESGNIERAVALLVKPIGMWYRVYGNDVGASSERQRVRAMIDDLARSNSVVAAEIASEE